MNILISSATGINNSGDEAILNCLINNLYLNKKGLKVFSFDINKSKNLHKNLIFLPHSITSFFKTIKEIKKCDLFIMGGGGLIQDQTSFLNPLSWYLKLILAISMGKKTYIYANSFGPIKYKLNKILTKKILNKVSLITVRDRQSKKLLDKIGVKKEVIVTADPVFGMKIKKEKVNLKIKNKYVVVFLRHWFDNHPFIPVKYCVKFGIKNKENIENEQKFIQEWRKLIDYINKDLGFDVLFVPMCSDRDYKIVDKILKKVNDKKMNHNLKKYYSPNQIVNLIKESEFSISMRLHSIIYSMLAGKKFLAISYSKKVNGLIEMTGLKHNLIKISEFDFKKTKNKINKIESVSNVFLDKMKDGIKVEKKYYKNLIK